VTVDLVKELSGEVFKTILLASGPALIVSLVVGLLISFFQAITQIQEFTLTFVPKVVAVFICIFLFLPWMAQVLITFTTNIFEKIPVYIR
jgi:flagellar biosynthetic protein FliQ